MLAFKNPTSSFPLPHFCPTPPSFSYPRSLNSCLFFPSIDQISDLKLVTPHSSSPPCWSFFLPVCDVSVPNLWWSLSRFGRFCWALFRSIFRSYGLDAAECLENASFINCSLPDRSLLRHCCGLYNLLRNVGVRVGNSSRPQNSIQKGVERLLTWNGLNYQNG